MAKDDEEASFVCLQCRTRYRLTEFLARACCPGCNGRVAELTPGGTQLLLFGEESPDVKAVFGYDPNSPRVRFPPGIEARVRELTSRRNDPGHPVRNRNPKPRV